MILLLFWRQPGHDDDLVQLPGRKVDPRRIEHLIRHDRTGHHVDLRILPPGLHVCFLVGGQHADPIPSRGVLEPPVVVKIQGRVQNVVIINNLVVVQLHHPEDPATHVQDRPANFKDPVDNQADLLPPVDGRIVDNLVVKEAGQFIEPVKVVVLAAEIEVVADQVLIAVVFEVKLA